MIVRFPGKVAQVARVSLAPPAVTLEEIEDTNTPWLTWPNYPELKKDHPFGPLRFMGLDRVGSPFLWANEVPKVELAELMQRQFPQEGYLTVIGGHFAMFNVMTNDYVTLADSLKHRTTDGQLWVRPGHRPQAKLKAQFLMDPYQTGSATEQKPLPRPYEFDTCWVGANGNALFDIRQLCAYFEKNLGIIGDPFAWQSVNGVSTVTVGEDT